MRPVSLAFACRKNGIVTLQFRHFHPKMRRKPSLGNYTRAMDKLRFACRVMSPFFTAKHAYYKEFIAC